MLLGTEGCVELLTSLLAKYVNNVSTNNINESKYEIDVEGKCKEETINYCTGALFNMMFDCDDNKNRLSSTDDDTLNLILLVAKIFTIYVDSMKASRNVIETLMRLMIAISCNHIINRDAILATNILPLVVVAMRRFANDEDIVRTSCEAFIHLHYYTEDQRKALLDKGLVDDQLRVIKLINNDDDNIDKVITLWNLNNLIVK